MVELRLTILCLSTIVVFASVCQVVYLKSEGFKSALCLRCYVGMYPSDSYAIGNQDEKLNHVVAGKLHLLEQKSLLDEFL
jgi:hypothetical protein